MSQIYISIVNINQLTRENGDKIYLLIKSYTAFWMQLQ